MLDIDGFKSLNDTYGHPTGDLVLRQVAAVLREQTRASDIVGRYGGDEFLLILPGDAAWQRPPRWPRSCARSLSGTPCVRPTGDEIRIRASFGVAAYPEDGRTIDELIAAADANLYASKNDGGDAVTGAGRSVRVTSIPRRFEPSRRDEVRPRASICGAGPGEVARAARPSLTGTMLVVLTALVVGVTLGYLAGGRLRNLERLALLKPWLVLAALGLQLVAFSPVGAALAEPAAVVLHFVSYALLVWFVVLNRRQLGVSIAGLGMGLNLVAIAANGGYMPASRAALDLAGIAYDGETLNNSGVMGAGTHLGFLGDVFAAPAWVPAANVFSVGDVLIVAGIALLLAVTMRAPRVTHDLSLKTTTAVPPSGCPPAAADPACRARLQARPMPGARLAIPLAPGRCARA